MSSHQNRVLSYPKRFSKILKKNNSTVSSFPNELLFKVFDYLNVGDLFKCALVCKQWKNVSDHKAYWMRWSRKFKCLKEFEKIHSENSKILPKICFKKLYMLKKENLLMKKFLKVSKKINNYTNLPDLKAFVNEVGKLEWRMDFLEKDAVKILYSKSANEINNFEASFSVIWSNLNELKQSMLMDLSFIRICVRVPVLLDLDNGELNTSISKIGRNRQNFFLIKSNDVQIFDLKITIRDLREKKTKNKSTIWNKLYEDSMIELFELNKAILIGFWRSTDNEIAFITYNTMFNTNFLKIVFSMKSNEKRLEPERFMHEFELDPNFGLHSYTVYVNIRNQTKTSFVSLCKKIFHADLTVTKEKKFLRLNVVDSDMVNEVGFKLSMLPKFSWSSESFSKNSIDLFALVDLCLFDSNMDIVFSECFPVNAQLNDLDSLSDNFTVDQTYEIKYTSENFVLNSSIGSMKDEYTGEVDSFYLSNLKLDLSLEFLNQWFGTDLK